MLINTFLHLPGITLRKERSLWRDGILTWDGYAARFERQGLLFAEAARDEPRGALDQGRVALDARDFDFFARALPASEHYRIALADPGGTVFVHVAATGPSPAYDTPILIGAGHAGGYLGHVMGAETGRLRSVLATASCIATLGDPGPVRAFLHRILPGAPLPAAAIDLSELPRPEGGETPPPDTDDPHPAAALYAWRDGDPGGLTDLAGRTHARVLAMRSHLVRCLPVLLERRDVPDILRTPLLAAWAGDGPEPAATGMAEPPPPSFAETPPPAITPRTTIPAMIADRAKTTRTPRIVGIALGAADRRTAPRPGGWCLIEGERVRAVARPSADADIIGETITAAPDLVVIGEPLSLPRQDGGRRACDRILHGLGVPAGTRNGRAAQDRVRRAAAIAARLRGRGIAVLETRPSVVLAALGLAPPPAGMRAVHADLRTFGLHGAQGALEGLEDGADALCAAVAGLCFWHGRFEAIGGPEEGLVILPDPDADPRPWRDRMVIGLSGPPRAGKTSAAACLRGHGFRILRLDGRPEDYGGDGTPETAETPERRACRVQIDAVPDDSRLVLDALGDPDHHALLTERFGPGFLHLCIDARESLRTRRAASDETTDWEGGHENDRADPSALAHETVRNDGPADRLAAAIEALIATRA